MAISNSLVKVGVFRSEGDGYQPPGEEVFSKNHISISFQIYFPSTTFSSCFLLSKCCDQVSLEELREERETHVQFAVPEMDRT